MRNMKKHTVIFYWLFAFIYWEILAHGAMFGAFQGSFRFALGFGAVLGLMIALIAGLFAKFLLFPVNLVLTVSGTLVYGSQMVYCFIFGTPYSISQMGLGGNALTQFWRETLEAMGQNWSWLVALLVPLAVLIVLRLIRLMGRPGWISRAVVFGLAAVTAFAVWMDIGHGDTAMFSDYYFFTSAKSTTAQTMERFGVPMTFVLELTRPEDTESGMTTVVIPTEEIPEETDPEETKPKEYDYNVLDIDFDALNAETTNKKIIALNDYVSQQPGTKQNEYTGMFRDYNLIYICAESFSPAAVDPVYTPTLYKLTHEGFVFENYYNSFPNTTTDGEYSFTQSLFPDRYRSKYSSSMMASAHNELPFVLGNMFQSELGIQSHGYHNNVGGYYSRQETHPNMGYEMKFSQKGMKFTAVWPTSDLEMMEQSVDDYIHEEQFHAYYMTFSGHHTYDPDINSIVGKHYDSVAQDAWPKKVQRSYVAGHMELDKALEYLINRLEEAGIADKTVIVMASDHTPYGLDQDAYFEMLGQEKDFFGWYKSNLIMWCAGMEETVVVDKYCCNVDVLPTVLNLWGFEYDSRMLVGTDIFSTGLHVAVLIDRSFLTDKVWFNTNTGKVKYLVPEEEVPEGYIESLNQLIASRFEYSAEVLRHNYFKHVFGQ